KQWRKIVRHRSRSSATGRRRANNQYRNYRARCGDRSRTTKSAKRTKSYSLDFVSSVSFVVQAWAISENNCCSPLTLRRDMPDDGNRSIAERDATVGRDVDRDHVRLA